MSATAAYWLVWVLAGVGLELAGLAGLRFRGHQLRPLTAVVRGDMRRWHLFAYALAAFLGWVCWHFLVATYA